MLIYVCDECGAPASVHISTETGRVIIDGIDAGQSAAFCKDHAPIKWDQPNNCKRVAFFWPSPVTREPVAAEGDGKPRKTYAELQEQRRVQWESVFPPAEGSPA